MTKKKKSAKKVQKHITIISSEGQAFIVNKGLNNKQIIMCFAMLFLIGQNPAGLGEVSYHNDVNISHIPHFASWIIPSIFFNNDETLSPRYEYFQDIDEAFLKTMFKIWERDNIHVTIGTHKYIYDKLKDNYKKYFSELPIKFIIE
jgi:hypothetical protein